MFYLYHSNKLDVLKIILAHMLKSDPQQNPFASEKILVQSPGMAQWLKIELAKELSICANIEFPLPASFIWQTFVDVLGDVPKRSAFNKDAMAWHIMARLPHHIDKDEFSELAFYLSDDDPLKWYQLAYKIADIFDQYLVYRPHWIQAWQTGSLQYSEQQPWQAILWHDLAKTIIDSGQSHYHRANLYEHLIDALKQDDVKDKLPPRIFIFGVSALAPKYLEALQAISEHCDVHFFLNNPCQVYWGDILDAKWVSKMAGQQRKKLNLSSFVQTNDGAMLVDDSHSSMFDGQGRLLVGNPLLASMGKLGRDNLALMVDLQAQGIEAFVEHDVEHDNASLLSQMNNDILHLNDPTFIARNEQDLTNIDARKIIEADDHSIVIHSCHSPMREIEVLHDQLLAMFEADPNLTPKDIVVMMPDVNSYSPYIQAVFSMAKHRIDFSISDRSAQQENPILLSFFTLLRLPQSRFHSSELFSLLEVPAIMEKFELTPVDLDNLKMWIDESGIRHGLGGQKNANDANSWQFGLNRMFKGYCVLEEGGLEEGALEQGSDNEHGLWQQMLAYPESSGMAAEKLGQLATFIQLIEQYSELLASAKSFSQWQSIISRMLAAFYQPSEENDQQLLLIEQALVTWHEELTSADYQQDIAAEIIIEHLLSKLGQGQSGQRFLAGKLNFCTLMPMRSIPFKVVCILGMNDGAYPRTIAPIGFDLMSDDVQKGDRSRRDDDRYLFLEAVLSAQQKLYLSYCGRCIKDNSVRGPSVLVTELTDYLTQSYRLAPSSALDKVTTLEQCSEQLLAHLITEHALAPFSAQYFDQSNALFSYQTDWLAALNVAADEITPPNAFLSDALALNREHDVIDVTQLIRFFKQPCKYFLNQRLGVYFNDHEGELSDSEPFDPDGLVSYQIKNSLLASYLAGDASQTMNNLRAQGILPHGHFADIYLDQQTEPMQALANEVKPHLIEKLDDVEVDLQFNIDIEQSSRIFTLQGWLKQHVAPNVLIRVKSGKGNAKFFMECYLDYLCFNAVKSNDCTSGDLLMFCQDGQWRFAAMPAVQAQTHLQRLITLYLNGQRLPIPFFIQCAWDYINGCFDDKNLSIIMDEKVQAKSDKALQNRFDGGFMMTGEGEDPYIDRCFSGLPDEVKQQLKEYAIDILLPLRQQLEELGNE